jgi:hypothetical protein
MEKPELHIYEDKGTTFTGKSWTDYPMTLIFRAIETWKKLPQNNEFIRFYTT